MGSTFSLVLFGNDPQGMQAAVQAAFEEAFRLEAMLSMFQPGSEWSRVNREASGGKVEITAELFDLLSRCGQCSRQSEGAFDISAAPLMRAWGFRKGEGRIPAEEEIASALKFVGFRHIVLDSRDRTVRFDLPGVELDPGGIGKGYAVDRMTEILLRRGCDRALVAASGSSLRAIGCPPEEPRGWPVGIRDPKNPRKTAAEVFLKDEALTTSGGSEKYFYCAGKVYGHILDPRTGYPAEGRRSVSVITGKAMDGEAYAKSCFLNGRSWAERHVGGEIRVFFNE